MVIFFSELSRVLLQVHELLRLGARYWLGAPDGWSTTGRPQVVGRSVGEPVNLIFIGSTWRSNLHPQIRIEFRMGRWLVPVSLLQLIIIGLLKIKKVIIIFNSINIIITYTIKWLNKHTMKCWARLSTNCCAPFWQSWLRTCVSTNSSIGLDLRSRDVAYNEKNLLTTNVLQFINKLIEQNISFKLILPSVSHVQQTEQSRRCALSPSYELADSGCQHRIVSVVWTAQMSRAQDSVAIYLPGCISVWNPSKPQHRSSLENPYHSRFFLPFFVLHTKNHATYFTQPKIIFRNINFCLKKILYCFRSYLVAAWFSHTLLTTVLCSLSQQNLCCV